MRRRDFIAGTTAALMPASVARAADTRPFMSLSYNPSGIPNEGQMARGIDETRIRLDLEQLKKMTGRVRTYTVSRGLDRVLTAAVPAGLKVSLGLQLTRDKAQNDLEFGRAMKLFVAFGKIIDRIYVGTDTLHRKIMTATELAGYVQRVRVFIASPTLTVGTSESWQHWIQTPELAKSCDFIGAHIFPYWNGVPVDAAVDDIGRRYDELKAAFPGKPIVISETGWPSAGPAIKSAVPSLQAQEQFARAFLARAATEKYDYNFAEAFDQPWKGKGIEGMTGASWGVFGEKREPKIPLVGR